MVSHNKMWQCHQNGLENVPVCMYNFIGYELGYKTWQINCYITHIFQKAQLTSNKNDKKFTPRNNLLAFFRYTFMSGDPFCRA